MGGVRGIGMRHSKGHFGGKHGGQRDFDIGDFLADFFWSHHHHHHHHDACGPWKPPVPEAKIAYRSADGSQNNKFDTTLNAAGTEFGRIGEAHFADGISEPLGGNNPRTISNLVVGAGDADVANPEGVSAFMYAWGQFIDHDMT